MEAFERITFYISIGFRFICPQQRVSWGRCILMVFALKRQSTAETNACDSDHNNDNDDYGSGGHVLFL